MDAAHRCRCIPLPDGRRIGAAEYGDPAGRPVFYFHGFPGSRIEARLAHEAAARAGIRLVALDRPGYGASDPQPGRTLHDWAEDVARCADALGLSRFAVLGLSGGGPYAAAVAAALPGRVRAAGLLSPLGPAHLPELARAMRRHQRLGFAAARRAPGLTAALAVPVVAVTKRFERAAFALMAAALPPPDRAVLRGTPAAGILLASFREAVRPGAAGLASDLAIYARPWGLDPGKIRVPALVWHGGADRTVPPAMGRHLAAAIPGCRARLFPGEGHFSLAVRHMDEILADLAAAAGRGPR
ncbi:alpha/beta hydrolase [Dissulfurirhabdus thermomarina]|uniref:Alpha/beta hydrolase n=1 Tax=Dissulfurirhabdus thermomarina TaxID=1765737 RepID=A0A6N9TQH7_DISTH|nr:alpha/beta fold hydrolase [Dissulfurirhabdus thermomarina]NDY42363.1 alpha/beta hydrolase [Dissulfurirhabdus thermomarina]NMX23009.1 alpha/beta hydrolase [Dissulfurirhabdus thermomarina]